MLSRMAACGGIIFALGLYFNACVETYGQQGRATIAGIVSGPKGEPVADLPIQARNKETGAVTRAMSISGGRYTLAGLTPGPYEISINAPAVSRYNPFSKENLMIKAGEALRFDIHLDDGDSLGTEGDDVGTLATMVRKRSVVPNRAVPRIAGKPDLSGVWIANEESYPVMSKN